MKLTRDEVYGLIDQERAYQNKWDELEDPNRQKDADKSVETWILWMEEYLAKAREASLHPVDKSEALGNIRKVLGLGVACLEYKGGPPRDEPVI